MGTHQSGTPRAAGGQLSGAVIVIAGETVSRSDGLLQVKDRPTDTNLMDRPVPRSKPAVVRRRAALTLILSCSLALVTSGCGGAADVAAEVPVRLGLLLPLSGGSAASGLAMRAAAQLTVDDANAAGGVLGRPVELLVEDDRCDPQSAVEAANRVVAAGAIVSVGGYCSSATVPTLKVFDDAGVPMVIPAANSSDLLTPPHPGVFLLTATVDSEALAAVPWMASLGAKRVAFVHDGTSYSLNLAEAGEKAVTASEQMVTADTLQVAQGGADFGTTARAVVAADTDLVYYTGYEPDAVQLAGDLQRAGYGGLFMGADGVVGKDYLTEAPRILGRDVYATVPPLAEHTPGAAAWTKRFTEKTGIEAIPYTLQAADAVTLALDAISRATSQDGEAITQAIAATRGLHLLTGPCTFDGGKVRVDVPFTLLRSGAGGVTSLGTSH